MQPYVILNSTLSLDGKTEGKEKKLNLSNRLNDHRVQTLRSQVDAVMISSEMISSKDFSLPTKEMSSKKPAVVVVDKNAEVSYDLAVFDDPNMKVIVAASKDAPKKRISKLTEEKNISVIVSGEHTVNLGNILRELYGRGIKKMLLEGDRALVRRMLSEGYVHELYVAVAPLIAGEGKNLIEGKLDGDVRLKLEGIVQYGDHVVLHYTVK